MIYTLKNYIEVYKKNIGSLKDIEELSDVLYGKTFLGNFLKNSSDLFSYKEIYQLEQEISILKQITLKKSSVHKIIKSLYSLYDYIKDKTEFIDYNQNQDLFLFSLVQNSEGKYDLKVYELIRISPTIVNEKDIEILLNELYKFNYSKVHSMLLFSNGFITGNEVSKNIDEIKKILDQKLLSTKAVTLLTYLYNSSKKIDVESFFLIEKYLHVYN